MARRVGSSSGRGRPRARSKWRRARRLLRRFLRARQHRRHRILALAGLVLLTVTLVAVDRLTGLRPPPRRLAGYRIVYDVTVTIDKPERSRREVLVRRPFESRDQTFTEGERSPTSGFVATRERSYLIQGGKVLDAGPRAPEPAPADYQLAVLLPELLRAGLAEEGGRRLYAGRA